MSVKPVPQGYHTVTPWIISRDTVQLIDYMKRAFGAEEGVHQGYGVRPERRLLPRQGTQPRLTSRSEKRVSKIIVWRMRTWTPC